MATIELPGAGTVTTFDGVPSPERDPFRHWRTQWRNKYREIKPEFSARTKRRREHDAVVPGDWSGIGIYRQSQATTISAVEATWIVPNCYLPPGAQKGSIYTASSWVGIDGDGPDGDKSSDIVQVGVDCDVVGGKPSKVARARAWWEWAKGASHWIHQLPVSPGDTLHAVIRIVAMAPGAKPKAAIRLHNKTIAIATSFMVEPIKGIQFIGNCAEWIVEKVESGLPAYGAIWFDGAKAFTDDQAEIGPEPSGTRCIPYEILGDQNQPISRGYVQGNNLVRCAYSNPNRTARAAKSGQ